ncbi:S1C family serine protease [Acinetobacter guillouiae]|uniref:Periplasmic serine peptidase DegS n=2 Tax=Acinetobacter guillouiae TaxID=106649 RepID=N8YD83_ACIGI|nr:MULTISPECIES: trypsin-like peptidase domain-containing protein [Acinetobacter]MCG7221922.1 trypsin-like peptidase domain-containing protein [Acinetobacter sp. AG3]MRT36241.1 PDZ domain-containing protein [Acinetobacter sp. RIT698]ENU58622.1 periplasmic serine peptidase DegS [Acinetobacter guillouiae CIP 63.46]ENV17290.1 periplasmic serine peptidase DegS [Acinetobacter guillouiae NIPH 991]EPH37866.1 Outer membrane stress sensor protease DegS [Acinetobacter guillouiae MSP4-18]
MRRSFTWLPWVLLILVIICFVVWQKLQQPKAPIAADGVKMPAEKVEPLVNTSRTGGVVSYSAAVKVAAPAVVNIFTTQKVKQNHPLLNDPAFREFFGNQIPEQNQNQNENSLGSGVIVRPDGYILTNNHVIAQADQIVVALQDGRRAEATVIGTDPDTDLAVIKIELKELPVLPFKLSGNEVGDVVLAIGNPFGVGQTVTQGIISATGRSDLGINTYEDFIQTDAAINPGNSGGALIDVAGNLIGVNTAIFSQSGGSLGIGFAIPAKICQQILNSILKDGRVIRGWMGISLVPPTQADVLQPRQPGVVVADVLKKGPAAEAGIKVGDRIVKVNNEDITSTSHLINYVALQAPNTDIQVEVIRGEQTVNLTVKVGERKVQSADSQFIPLPRR